MFGCQILDELNLYLFCWKIASASFWDFGAKPISTSKLEFGGFVYFVVKKVLSLYIKNYKLQVQEETLSRLGYTTLGKYKLQS